MTKTGGWDKQRLWADIGGINFKWISQEENYLLGHY